MAITRAETQPGQQPRPEQQWKQLMEEISRELQDPRYINNPKKLKFLKWLIRPTINKLRTDKKVPEIEITASPLEILARAWGYEIPDNFQDLIIPLSKIDDKNLIKDKPTPPQAPDLNLPEQ